MHRSFIFIPLLCLPLLILAQIEQNFDIGSLQELEDWSGDIEDFIINDDKQLQLAASEAGSSVLFVSNKFNGHAEWQFYINLLFAPSNANQLNVYLFSDSEDLNSSNAYFLQIGETGAQDNLKFYRQDNGRKILLGEGNLASLASSPANVRVKIVRSLDGIWSIYTAYDSAPFVQLEFELSDDQHQLKDGFFALSCKYSTTRRDKFFFDDFYIGDVKEDTNGPVLVSAKFIDPHHISLVFDELISQDSGFDISNYQVNNNIGLPLEVSFGEFENELILLLSSVALEGLEYDLSILNIADLSGNEFSGQRKLYLTSVPLEGDLIINEILFNPFPESEDIVELYNTSSKYLDLSRLVIQNNSNGRSTKLGKEVIMKPNQILAITPDVQSLYQYYVIKEPENIINSTLPLFSNSDGNVSISIDGSDLLDSFDYDENYHADLIDNNEGVSLERIDPFVSSEIIANWQSASAKTGFATPGYENSNFTLDPIEETEFYLEKKTFSPDGDGFDDFLELKYRVESLGFVLNMKVFDERGHLIRTLANNELITTNGSVIWDGMTNSGIVAGMGIYVIWLEYFNTEGTIEHKKLSCVLAKQLN